MTPEKYHIDRQFDGLNTLSCAEYEQCVFNECDLSECDLSAFKFVDSIFQHCNLSLTKIQNTAFRNVKFKHCKMLGLQFEDCASFGLAFSFEDCQLNHASFFKVKMPKTVFRDTPMIGVDFTGADLSGAVLANCNLSEAIFDLTNLEGADLYSAYNFSINPENNSVKMAKFSLFSLSGLLDKYEIEIIE